MVGRHQPAAALLSRQQTCYQAKTCYQANSPPASDTLAECATQATQQTSLRADGVGTGQARLPPCGKQMNPPSLYLATTVGGNQGLSRSRAATQARRRPGMALLQARDPSAGTRRCPASHRPCTRPASSLPGTAARAASLGTARPSGVADLSRTGRAGRRSRMVPAGQPDLATTAAAATQTPNRAIPCLQSAIRPRTLHRPRPGGPWMTGARQAPGRYRHAT